MAGVALLLDLLKRNKAAGGGGGFPSQSSLLHSHGLFSAAIAASAAAASIAGARPFASRGLFGDGGISVAFCDSGTAWNEDNIPNIHSALKDSVHHGSITYRIKEYPLELKPLFSAFGLRSLAMTSLRSFLMFYLPLLEPRPPVDEDEIDFLQDAPEEEPVDLVVPFKKSLIQIARETTVVTTRRILERLAVHYVSQRMAWKLLKDAPRSARRKAERGMPTLFFFYSVGRTTFRGHILGVAASWIVQVGIEIYRCLFRKPDNDKEVNRAENVQLLWKRIHGATVRCGASLVFASVGAGIGALFHPSIGQWIGCAVGDFGGPIVITLCFEKFLHLEI